MMIQPVWEEKNFNPVVKNQAFLFFNEMEFYWFKYRQIKVLRRFCEQNNHCIDN